MLGRGLRQRWQQGRKIATRRQGDETMPYQSVFRPDLFKGQTIIVTGGGSGIGRCTAHELAALGANVVIVGRNPEKLATVEAEIREDGGEVSTHICDIREEATVGATIDAVL